MKPTYLQLDTRDDRREICTLLDHLSPSARVRFLEWCCTRATLRGSPHHPAVAPSTYDLARLAFRDDSASPRLTLDVYVSIWNICSHYDFSIEAALAELVRRVKKL